MKDYKTASLTSVQLTKDIFLELRKIAKLNFEKPRIVLMTIEQDGLLLRNTLMRDIPEIDWSRYAAQLLVDPTELTVGGFQISLDKGGITWDGYRKMLADCGFWVNTKCPEVEI